MIHVHDTWYRFMIHDTWYRIQNTWYTWYTGYTEYSMMIHDSRLGFTGDTISGINFEQGWSAGYSGSV